MVLRRLIQLARLAWNAWIWEIYPQLIFRLSPPRRPVQAVSVWPQGTAELGPRVALFVHFDRRGEVRPYVLHYLHQLKAAGLSVVFVTNAGQLQPGALEAIKPICAGILIRRNVGYDFAAMREALACFALPRADTEMLILANDSVYGPLRPLDDLLARIDFERADFWGATESWQSRYHLQSFFLVAGPALLRSAAWSSFWAQVRSVPSKRWVITQYEVGVTQWMLRAGMRCAAVWTYDSLVQGADTTMLAARTGSDPVETVRGKQMKRIRAAYVERTALNPTSDMWRQLLLAGFPFLKRELLRDNPTRVADVIDWRLVLAETTQADVTLIERDLQRLVRNSAP